MIELYSRMTRPTVGGTANALPSDAPSVEVDGPVKTVSQFLALQSYFDSALLEQAILVQNQASGIVAPGVNQPVLEEQTAGYAVAVMPFSEAPVAFEFIAGGQNSSSAAQIVKPGEVLRPHGLGMAGSKKSGAFGGFRYGLPTGWLGGGNVQIAVFRTPDAGVYFTGGVEVLFHRQRIKALSGPAIGEFYPGISPFPGFSYNWPLSFPWANGRNQNNQPQTGSPRLTVTPTRTVFRLRAGGATPLAFNVIVRGSFALEAGADGTTIPPLAFLTPTQADRLVFPPALLGPGPGSAYPQVELRDGICVNMGGPQARLDIVSELAAPLNGYELDVLRYGRIG